jgi:GNAT superfamily N-acetyltransferase
VEDGKVIAVMGYRILFDFVHGKHLYIDDLVTTEACRSKGYGAQLLSFAERKAQRQGCQGLRLCTGVENENGKRFYERHGWNPRTLAYKKRVER